MKIPPQSNRALRIHRITSISHHLTSPLRLPLPLYHHHGSKHLFSTTSLTCLSDLPTPPLAPPNPHRAYYQTHGRALFKCLTLAFLSYQIVYWTWLTLETEEIRDGKNREIKGLEGEVRLLVGGRGAHLGSLEKKEGREREGMEGG